MASLTTSFRRPFPPCIGVVMTTTMLLVSVCFAGDPTVPHELRLSYDTAAPLGVVQQIITVNNKFPGPTINVTTNNQVVVNVWNDLDEGVLLNWNGIQMRTNSWQDGVLGTNCPITPGKNWTYHFQVKDQIGSFFYFPSLGFQRASGGFGSFIVTNRPVIPIPFSMPDGDIEIFIGDWYNRNHTSLRSDLDAGKMLGVPDGVIINGKGPYRYNQTLVPAGIEYTTIRVDPGKTYRIRVHNVGISTSLNFRIQNHLLILVETEGTYTQQQSYKDFDIHVGQSYTFLVNMDQNATTDYYIVASAVLVDGSEWERVTGVAILQYSNSRGPASGPLPPGPDDTYYKGRSMNQALSVRMNGSASGARPNPQGSFRYGQINVTDFYLLESRQALKINGSLRSTLNNISFKNPTLPIRLADLNKVKGVYKLDFPSKPTGRQPSLGVSLINATFKGFIEVVLQNNDTSMRSFHLDGYAFFVVGMGYGNWTASQRGSYNRWDGISRSTTQVYPGAWTAILISLDNAGAWNFRSQNLDRWYLGEETYFLIVNPGENNTTEMRPPDNVRYCSALESRNQESSSGLSAHAELLLSVLAAIAAISVLTL
uniref:Monocopper oxidase-like protein SKU5 n=1 Tax=Kalanchoe fedtschenkoi TaxID=63787 RepID=A0A7N0UZ41_KALFE